MSYIDVLDCAPSSFVRLSDVGFFLVMEDPPLKKANRTRLTLAEQVEAVRILRAGTNAVNIMSQFGIRRHTETNIKKTFDGIIKRADEDRF